MTVPQGQSPAGWQGQWAEQPPPPPERPSRSPLYFLIFAGVVLFVTVAVIFYLQVFHTSTQAANPNQLSTEASVAPTPSQQQSATEDSEAALTEARNAVSALAQSPECSDPTATAQTILTLANQSTDSTDMQTIKDSLTKLSEACDPQFTVGIRSAFDGAQVPTELATLVSSNDWVTLERPAPEGAISATEFTTPADNIRCRFDGDDVACSIYVYDYPSPDGCEGKTATYRINPAGEVSAGCTEELNAAAQIDYGQTVQHNGYACSIDQYEGVTCWNELTGNGFQLRRAADRTF
ncbi:hypothetical protein VR010_08120 [Actinomycetaceae bacterium L2_0104]